jgi:antibiotic biosynthesis monooxygenase (ABM) superfamily enzyme
MSASPKRWKMMLLTWLFVYPVINVLFMLLMPLMAEQNQWVKTLVLTLILVPLMGAVLPRLHQRFGSWIAK